MTTWVWLVGDGSVDVMFESPGLLIAHNMSIAELISTVAAKGG